MFLHVEVRVRSHHPRGSYPPVSDACDLVCVSACRIVSCVPGLAQALQGTYVLAAHVVNGKSAWRHEAHNDTDQAGAGTRDVVLYMQSVLII